ncbi:malonyl-CoA decarboxylase [Pseudophaeobacter arcticus]|uniref:malonyl-CoA decarboxylase n=1 Tax=Pseudophaeobacter arcticus TaxID=385492 RepID=UPI002490C44E|nr:malonyl-CoA decarboxylase [Pseudophaeobacter arcticus]
MTLLADLLATVFDRRAANVTTGSYDDSSLLEMVDALMVTRSETQVLGLAREILARFPKLTDEQKLAFFRHLAIGMDIDPQAVRAALNAYEAAPSQSTYRAFLAAAEPQRQELVRRLNQAPNATAALVQMRTDLLRLGRDDATLSAIDLDFRHLFVSWFNRGFLVLRPISWESPAHILEKVIAYEAVHEIQSWDDLRRRLAPEDRRCFAFFHPAMPDEPLIFVEVALTKGRASSIQALLSEDRTPIAASDADTAVFYSISNCQPGLAQISFGSSLIKQVATDLAAEQDGLKTFVTLSPIPGLRKWSDQIGAPWDPDTPETMQGLAAHYLVNAKRDDGLPFDPVARFHLGNGAVISDIYPTGDQSPKGLEQSGGVMVSYYYDLAKVTDNQEHYIATKDVQALPSVKTLAKATAGTIGTNETPLHG